MELSAPEVIHLYCNFLILLMERNGKTHKRKGPKKKLWKDYLTKCETEAFIVVLVKYKIFSGIASLGVVLGNVRVTSMNQ